MPLFPSKERERGYNQAVLIADAALAELEKSQAGVEAARGASRDSQRVKDTREPV